MPLLDDEVVVGFLNGEFSTPCVLGAMWNPRHAAPSADPRQRMLRSANGHTIRLIDSTPNGGDQGALVIEDGHGNIITMSNGYLRIEATAVLELHAPQIVFSGPGYLRPVIQQNQPVCGRDGDDRYSAAESVTRALAAPRCLDMRLPEAKKRIAPAARRHDQADPRHHQGAAQHLLAECQSGAADRADHGLHRVPDAGAEIHRCASEGARWGEGPFKIITAFGDIVEAGKDVAECIANVTTPALGIWPFLKDLLLMIARMLRCIVETLKSIVSIMDGLELQIASARQNGNDELLAQLACARENAEIAAAGQMTAIEPIQVLLDLAKPFFAIGGVPEIALPAFGSDTDVESLKSLIETLDTVLGAIETAAEAVPV
jgi:hypothetical protein